MPKRLNVSLITYDIAHGKTQDVLFRLLRRPGVSLSLTTVAFNPRPERKVLFSHRPYQFVGPSTKSIAKALGLASRSMEQWRSFHASVDFFLICAGILIDMDFVTNTRAINCHAGLIPQTRGLDAFKWAIHQQQSIGNTLHFVDAEIDLGKVFHQEVTPIFCNDDLATFARRHYDAEIDLLANFDRYLEGGRVLDLPRQEPRKRMPVAIEQQMIDGFAEYKKKFATKSVR